MGLGCLPERPALARPTAYRPAYHRPGPLGTLFICIDALDECPPGHRIKLLYLLNQILQKSPGARIFMTGRPHILGEVEKHLGGSAATRSITPTKNDIITFLRAKLKEDTMPGAMDESLEQEIIQNIPEAVSEM